MVTSIVHTYLYRYYEFKNLLDVRAIVPIRSFVCDKFPTEPSPKFPWNFQFLFPVTNSYSKLKSKCGTTTNSVPRSVPICKLYLPHIKSCDGRASFGSFSFTIVLRSADDHAHDNVVPQVKYVSNCHYKENSELRHFVNLISVVYT